jgi:hypothetical protein
MSKNSISGCQSGSGNMMPIRPDPDPQHWIILCSKEEQKTILQSNNKVALNVIYLHLRYGMVQYTRRHWRRPLAEIETYVHIPTCWYFLGESKENCVGRGGGELPTPSSTPTSVRKNRQVQPSVTCVKIYCWSHPKFIAEIGGGGKLSVSRNCRRIWRKCLDLPYPDQLFSVRLNRQKYLKQKMQLFCNFMTSK